MRFIDFHVNVEVHYRSHRNGHVTLHEDMMVSDQITFSKCCMLKKHIQGVGY